MCGYEITLDGNIMVISGRMRLSSPTAYNEPFKLAFEGIAKSDFIVDLRKLDYLNSSGISVIARLALVANNNANYITFIISDTIPWQNKTMSSFKYLSSYVKISYN